MRFRGSVLLTLPLLLAACGQAELLPKPKPAPKTNSIRIAADLATLEIPKHALGEGWERTGHEHSTTPAFPPRGAFKGVGESHKLDVTFSNPSPYTSGKLSLVASQFNSAADAEAMLEIILITQSNSKFTETKVFGYNAYDYQATNSRKVGKMLQLGTVLVSVFSDDARSDADQERLLRYLFSRLDIPTKKN